MSRTLIIALAILTLSVNIPALASGGGGGSSAPSATGPSYDPVEEYQKGLQALRDGEYAKAERAMKKVVRVAKKDANSHYILGLAHYGQDEFKNAYRALSKAVRYDETLYDAQAKLGISYLKAGKASKADGVWNDLTHAQQTCGATCPDAAAIDRALGEIAAARVPENGSVDTTSLAPVITQASLDHGDMLYSEAVRLINLERYDEAIVELKAAGMILGPHPDVLTYLGFANRKKGNVQAAFAFYSTALQIAPEHLNANEYLGEYYVEIGDFTSAQIQLMKLEAFCPFGCVQTEELRRWMSDSAT